MEKAISLYEMTNDFVELVELEEVDEGTREQILEAMQETINNKAENVIGYIKTKENLIKSIKEEEKRLAEYRKIQENQLKRMEKYTIECLERLGGVKKETPLGRIGLAKKPKSLVVLDENKVPDIYKTVEEVIKIDKAQIKKDLKEHSVDGVELKDGGYRLNIK